MSKKNSPKHKNLTSDFYCSLNKCIICATINGIKTKIAFSDAAFYNYVFTQKLNSDFIYNQFRSLCKTVGFPQVISGEKGIYYIIHDQTSLDHVKTNINRGDKPLLCYKERVASVEARFIELLFRLLNIKSSIAYYLFIYILNHYFIIDNGTKTENFFTTKGATIDDAIAFIQKSLETDKNAVNSAIDSALLASVTKIQIKYALKLLKEKRLISDLPTNIISERNSPSDIYIVCFDAANLASQTSIKLHAYDGRIDSDGKTLGYVDADDAWTPKQAQLNSLSSELRKYFIKTILSIHNISVTSLYCAIFNEILHSAYEAQQGEVNGFKIDPKIIAQKCDCNVSYVYKAVRLFLKADNNLLVKRKHYFFLNDKVLKINDIGSADDIEVSVNQHDFSIEYIKLDNEFALDPIERK